MIQTHLFVVGLYNISLHISNNVSVHEESFLHYVGQLIRGFAVTVFQEFHGGPDGMYDYIEEGENITLVPSVSELNILDSRM